MSMAVWRFHDSGTSSDLRVLSVAVPAIHFHVEHIFWLRNPARYRALLLVTVPVPVPRTGLDPLEEVVRSLTSSRPIPNS